MRRNTSCQWLQESRCWTAMLAAVALVFMLGGCDTSVDLFVENEQSFSVHGFVDAARDTQRVRVEALRDGGLYDGRDTIDAQVTLEHVESGTRVALRHAVYRLPVEQRQAHVFHTVAMDILPRETYRLTVERSDGRVSAAQTTVPPPIQKPPPGAVPTLVSGRPGCGMIRYPRSVSLFLAPIDRLVKAEVIYHPEDASREPYAGRFERVEREGSGYRFTFRPSACRLGVDYITLVVAAGSADWPDYAGLGPEDAARPGIVSNVEGGIGFFGGAVTQTVTVDVRPYGEPTEGAEGR